MLIQFKIFCYALINRLLKFDKMGNWLLDRIIGHRKENKWKNFLLKNSIY